MGRKHKVALAILLIVCVTSVIVHYTVVGLRVSLRAAVGSCLSSLSAAFQPMDFEEIRALLKDSSDKWVSLKNPAYSRVIQRLFTLSSLDCHHFRWIPGGTLVDPWDNPVRILVRNASRAGDEIEYRICSDGSDGLPETRDDIVANAKWPRPSFEKEKEVEKVSGTNGTVQERR